MCCHQESIRSLIRHLKKFLEATLDKKIKMARSSSQSGAKIVGLGVTLEAQDGATTPEIDALVTRTTILILGKMPTLMESIGKDTRFLVTHAVSIAIGIQAHHRLIQLLAFLST